MTNPLHAALVQTVEILREIEQEAHQTMQHTAAKTTFTAFLSIKHRALGAITAAEAVLSKEIP